MTKVYRVRNDVNNYQYFMTAKSSERELLHTLYKPMLQTWNPPEVFVYQPLKPKGVFRQFSSDTLILPPDATEALRFHLEMAGELLPLPFQGETYTMLNILECINCLDNERSEFSYIDGMRAHLLRHRFHKDRFSESTLFKIPESYVYEVLAVEFDPDEGFVADLRRHEYQGYKLKLLWDSDNDD